MQEKWTGHVARMDGNRTAYRSMMETPERKKPLARPNGRWEGNLNIDLKGIGWGGTGLE